MSSQEHHRNRSLRLEVRPKNFQLRHRTLWVVKKDVPRNRRVFSGDAMRAMRVLWIDKPTIEKWTIDDARRLRGLGNHDVPITRFGEIQKT